MTTNGHHPTAIVPCPRCDRTARKPKAWLIAVTCECGCRYEAHPLPRAGSGPNRDVKEKRDG